MKSGRKLYKGLDDRNKPSTAVLNQNHAVSIDLSNMFESNCCTGESAESDTLLHKLVHEHSTFRMFAQINVKCVMCTFVVDAIM